MRLRRPSAFPTLLLIAATLAGLVGCGVTSPPRDTSHASGTTDDRADALGDGHGAIAGAREVAEPPLGLTSVDPAGALTHLDLIDESVTDLGTIDAPSAMATDGRYLFATTDRGVEVVDSGVWTWDHVDHFHYYRAEPRLLGVVPGRGPATVATTTQSTEGGTGIFFASGEAVLLDTAALSRGEITELFRIDAGAHHGMVVPVGRFALVTQAGAGDSAGGAPGADVAPPSRVAVHDAGGAATGVEAACPEASGTITTRVGAVIGCSDGALLATVAGDEVALEKIPHPAGTTGPPRTFAGREGRPTVAGLGDAHTIWLLDTRQRTWTALPAPAPLVAVSAVDDEADHVLAVGEDGRLLVIDGADGTLRAQTEPLVAESLAQGHAPALIVDAQRAYLSAPVEQRVFEIDFADDARIARTFSTTALPAFTAGTGR